MATSTVFKQQLNRLFKGLRARGLFARQSFLCCDACAGAEIAVSKKLHQWAYVYYHKQAAESIERDGSVYLSYGHVENTSDDAARGVAAVVVDAAQQAGLRVKWDGNVNIKILVCSTDSPAILAPTARVAS